MKDVDKNDKSLTPAILKLLDAGSVIYDKPATSKDAAYMASELVQCTLPHKDPKNIPEWVRRNGNITLSIKAGYKNDPKDPSRRIFIGYPYGSIPRLILFWIITEAIRTKSRRLELGHSLRGFMAELGLNSSNGSSGAKRSDARRLRNQMERLFNAFFSFEGSITQDGRIGTARLNMVIARATMLWWSEKSPEQGALWGSWIELGEDFYNAIIAAPVPVDMRALQALKQSPVALDLYAWLAREAFFAHKNGKSRFTSFEKLHNQFGGEYADLADFRKKAVKPALAKIKVVYPNLKLGKKQGGIEILPESLPALQPQSVTIEGTAEPQTPPKGELSLVAGQGQGGSERPLKTTSIELFRKRYPRLDPYACKIAFDMWLAGEGKTPPDNYDAAFLGFAKKWTAGKL